MLFCPIKQLKIVLDSIYFKEIFTKEEPNLKTYFLQVSVHRNMYN